MKHRRDFKHNISLKIGFQINAQINRVFTEIFNTENTGIEPQLKTGIKISVLLRPVLAVNRFR